MKDRIRNFFSEELVENTYLFCYKRLGNPEDARDLAQEIFCEALSGFHKRSKIEYPEGWYWKLAKNRYATYVRKRNDAAKECFVEDTSWEYLQYFSRDYFFSLPESVLEQMEREEEISRLHASIAKVSKIHREILIQFYIKNHSVQEISENLHLPEGTVKRRLFDARRNVRERMEQMPVVTKLSYAPQEMELWMSKDLTQVDAIQDVLGKQILASCYARGRTVEELSEELQVASVYLEDKINRLCYYQVLKPEGSKKFLTNFIVLSKNHVTEMMRQLDKEYMDLCEKIGDFLEASRQEILDIGFYGCHFPEKYLNLALYYAAMEIQGILAIDAYQKSDYWHGGEVASEDFYGILNGRLFGQVTGAEEIPSDYQCKAMEWMMDYKNIKTREEHVYNIWNCYDRAPYVQGRLQWLHENNIDLLWELGKDSQRVFSEKEWSYISGLLDMGLVKKTDTGICPTVVMFSEEQIQQLNALLYSKLEPLTQVFLERVVSILNKWILPYVRKDLLEQYYNYAVNIFLNPSSNMMWWGYHHDKFEIPEDYTKTGEGLFVIRRK